MNPTIRDTCSKVIEKRCSVRHFTEERLSKDQLNCLIKAGIQAPSGSNWQNQRFLVIDDKEEILRIGKSRFVWPYKGANQAKVRKTHPGGIVGNAAAIIIVFADSLENDRRGNGEYYLWESLEIQNCSASIENILLLATAMGIANCWVSASDKMNYTRMFSGQSWRKLLTDYDIPPYYKLQGIIILGYPKSVDEEGFPVGEKKHGATVWQSTERKPVEHYLIQRRAHEREFSVQVKVLDSLKIRILSKMIKWMQKATLWCDRKIHRIEIVKYLKP